MQKPSPDSRYLLEPGITQPTGNAGASWALTLRGLLGKGISSYSWPQQGISHLGISAGDPGRAAQQAHRVSEPRSCFPDSESSSELGEAVTLPLALGPLRPLWMISDVLLLGMGNITRTGRLVGCRAAFAASLGEARPLAAPPPLPELAYF